MKTPTSIGIFPSHGGFTARTLSQSKTFKTMDGAERWLAKHGYDAEGNRLDPDNDAQAASDPDQVD